MKASSSCALTFLPAAGAEAFFFVLFSGAGAGVAFFSALFSPSAGLSADGLTSPGSAATAFLLAATAFFPFPEAGADFVVGRGNASTVVTAVTTGLAMVTSFSLLGVVAAAVFFEVDARAFFVLSSFPLGASSKKSSDVFRFLEAEDVGFSAVSGTGVAAVVARVDRLSGVGLATGDFAPLGAAVAEVFFTMFVDGIIDEETG